MNSRLRMFLLATLVAVFGFGVAGTALAQDVPGAGRAGTEDECVEDVLDLPALNVCKDAAGRHILDAPALTLRGEAPTDHHKKHVKGHAHRALPRTGLGTEDFAAIGMAALAGGAVLLRRLRLAVS